MKKIIGIVVAIIVIACMAAPVIADTTTSVEVLGPSGGDPPIIKCKWEFPDNVTGGGASAGTQIDPPLVWEANVPVQYFAVVTDPQGKSNINKVYVDVWHPELPCPENGSFKYQLELTVQDKDDPNTGTAAFEKAITDGTIVLSDPANYPVEEIREELTQCHADIYMVEGDLYFEQPAGDYKVQIKAVDKQGNVTILENVMEYLAVAGIEVDFTSINYGSISVCDNQLVDGDTTWASGPAGVNQDNQATVRNIGNTWAKVSLVHSDLMQGGVPLGKTGDIWNVQYDARVGHEVAHTLFWPEQQKNLPTVLELSEVEKMDFSMHITKAGISGTWTGTMTIGCVKIPFS
jgi:hypothetical protein